MTGSHDMLVRLATFSEEEAPRVEGVVIRRAYGPEMERVTAWVREQFGEGWASEVAQAFYGQPKRCLIATKNGQLLGVGAYDSSHLGVAGPLGVHPSARGLGVGAALIRALMIEMKRRGYRYAILGWIPANVQEFHRKATGAVNIEESVPGMEFFQGLLTLE